MLRGCLAAIFVVAGLSAQEVRDTVGPLETQASPITPDNSIPRRTFSVAPGYPREGDGIHIVSVLEVELVATLDDQGRVAEIQKVKDPITPPASWLALPMAARVAADAFTRESAAALRQWTYEPPARAPISFFVTFSFRPRGDVTATQYASPPPHMVRVGSVVGAPGIVSRVEPIYPAAALKARVEGVVILKVRIDVDGTVAEAKVLRGIPLLDQAALDAVNQWMYKPTVFGGTVISTILAQTVTFTLPDP